MKPLQILVLFVALLLCLLFTLVTWPGSSTHGHFYPYPVDLALFRVWAIAWVAILTPTVLLLRRIRKR